MSKGQEALNETVNKFADVILLGVHEERNATNLTNAIDYLERTPQIRTLRKCVKALEIIKEKDVNIWYLTVSTKVKNYKDYNSFLMNDKDKRQLTEEEFYLLKEVLE